MLSLSDIQSRFEHRRIAVIGDVMLDRYLIGSVDRISPEAPVPVLKVEQIQEHAGGAANVAVNLSSLGARVLLAAIVGTDAAARKLRQLLRQHGIRQLLLHADDRHTTTIKTRLMARSHQMLRYDQETIHSPDPATEREFLQQLLQALKSFRPEALIFQDYNKGLLTPTVIKALMDYCRKQGILTAADPKKFNFFSYKHVDLFKPNLREVREALGLDSVPVNHSSLLNIHAALQRRLAHRITLLTLAERGIFYAAARQAGLIAAQPRDVADVSGAGDTVIAVATLSLAAGFSLEQAAQLANLCGGLVCEHAGVVPVTYAMLRTAWKS